MLRIVNKTNYLAKCVKLGNPVKHSNADKLQGWIIDGNRCWTDLSYKSGDTVVFFPCESALNAKLLSALNLFENKSKNSDPTKRGYINDKCRVRAIRLRNEPSEGLILPWRVFVEGLEKAGIISSLETSKLEFREGVEFDYVSDVKICEKYFVPVSIPQESKDKSKNVKKKKKQKRFDVTIEGQFSFHDNTSNLGSALSCVNPDSIISISEKFHGTSFVTAKVLKKRKLSLKERIAKWFGVKVVESEYGVLYSSRNTLKNKYDNSSVSDNDLWKIVSDEISSKLLNGISIYGEIVGFQPSGNCIQKRYDYGCDPSKAEHRTFVYKITYTSPTGEVYHFPWSSVQQYCNSFGLQTVPCHFNGRAGDFCKDEWDLSVSADEGFEQMTEDEKLVSWREFFFKKIKKLYLEKDCVYCKNTVPNEGVCVKIDSLFSNDVYKAKSFKFKELETKSLDAGEIDIESSESANSDIEE